jgi:glucose/arabinose dehydrogenase
VLPAAIALGSCGKDDSYGARVPTATSGVSAAPTPRIKLQKLAHTFKEPIFATAPAGASRLYVVERAGRVIMGSGTTWSTFLDIRSRVGSNGSEQGLLSIAFHPKYSKNHRVFADYTDRNGDTHVVEFKVSATTGKAHAGSERLLLKIKQPYQNHNGGLLKFGPDNNLYIGMGDGGSSGDPQNRAQNRKSLLGKILRINVDGAKPYTVPKSNPWSNGSGGRKEIWLYGVRNPWRFAFDSPSGLMYIGDVGQNEWEEIDVFKRSTGAGRNLGWDKWEGTHIFERKTMRGTHTKPVLQYSHGAGCSVTGGEVYRGARVDALKGWYLYADFCQNWIKAFRYSSGKIVQKAKFGGVEQISSFGTGGNRDVYVVSLSGGVYRIAKR